MYRQGDVLLVPVTGVPHGWQRWAGREIILAEGEATGHAHRVEGEGAVMYVNSPDMATAARILQLALPAKVTHEEHAPIDLPAGTYSVLRQREYTPTSRQVRNEPRPVVD